MGGFPSRGAGPARGVTRRTPGATPLAADDRSPPRAMPVLDDTPRVRAPDFPDNLEWVNTGGRRLSLAADLRGRIVFLDFWTYG